MENFEKCTVAMLGGLCSQHVTGNTSWLNQPQSAIIPLSKMVLLVMVVQLLILLQLLLPRLFCAINQTLHWLLSQIKVFETNTQWIETNVIITKLVSITQLLILNEWCNLYAITMFVYSAVTCFGLKINERPSCIAKDIFKALFVDDLAICFRGRSLDTIERHLQQAVNAIQEWATRNGFRFAAHKCKVVHFTAPRSRAQRPPIVRIGNTSAGGGVHEVPWVVVGLAPLI